MPGVAVETLDLKLTAPAALRPRAAMLARGAEQELMPAVLRAMERRLTDRYGERAAIRIRSLDLRLRLIPDDLTSPDYAEAVGEDIAEQILAMAIVETASARSRHGDAPVRIWRDVRQLTAARLAAAARRDIGPCDVKDSVEELWSALVEQAPGEIALVLSELAKVDELSKVLCELPLPALRLLEETVSPVAAPAVRRRIRDAVRHRHAQARRPIQPQARPESSIQQHAEIAQPAKERPGPEAQPPVRQTAVARPEARQIDDAAAPLSSTRAEDDIPKTSPTDGAPPAFDAASPGVHQPDVTNRVDSSIAVPESSAPAETEVSTDSVEIETEPWLSSYPSNWCALGYLLQIALKAELPEALWQVGVDEGAVLCKAFTTIAGTDADPATRILSRSFPEEPPTIGRVPDWARDEVTASALDRVAASGIDRAGLSSRVAVFDAVLSVDGQTDIATWVAALLLATFEATTAIPLSPGQLDLSFARDGRIECEGDVIRIVQPLDAIDIAIRRAGLDADPGWLPWLEKRVTFVFEGGEDGA